MPSKPNEGHRLRAEAKFKKKELQAKEADKVWTERATAAAASDQNAARLKGLRLAKEAAETQANAKAVRKPKAKKGDG